MPAFTSPAFLQQCFASHRHSLALKQFKEPRILIVCRLCKIRHVLTVQRPSSVPSASTAMTHPVVVEPFTRCTTEHLSVLGVTSVDIAQNALELHCAQCRKAYPLTMTKCETDIGQGK